MPLLSMENELRTPGSRLIAWLPANHPVMRLAQEVPRRIGESGRMTWETGDPAYAYSPKV